MNIRLVCRQSNGEERKVMLAATNFATISEVAAQRLDCSSADVILQLKEGDDLWEIEESFWPSLSEGHTLYAHTIIKKAKGTKRKASLSNSISAATPGGFWSDTATSAGDEAGPSRPGASRRFVGSDRSGQQDAEHDSVSASTPYRGVSIPRTPSRGTSSASRSAINPSAGTSFSSNERRTEQASRRPEEVWAHLQAPDPQSSHKKWDAKADAILWNRLRTIVEAKKKEAYTVAERMDLFKQILAEHGTHGTVTRALSGRNAVALNARASQKINGAVRMGLPLADGLRELFIKPRNDGAGASQSKSRSPSANRRNGRESGGESATGETSSSTQRNRQQRRRNSSAVEDDSSAQSDGDDEESDSGVNNNRNTAARRRASQGIMSQRNGPHAPRQGGHTASSRTSNVNGTLRAHPDNQRPSAPLPPTFAGNATNHRRWNASSSAASTRCTTPGPLRGSQRQANSGLQPPEVRATRQELAQGPYDESSAIGSRTLNGSAAASGYNAIPLQSRDGRRTENSAGQAATSNTSGTLSNEVPLFLAEENARMTHAAQAAVNPFLVSSRVPREIVMARGQPAAGDKTEVQDLVTRNARGRAAISTSVSTAATAAPERAPVVKDEDEVDELDEESITADADAVAARKSGSSVRTTAPQVVHSSPPPFLVAKDASPADVTILQVALHEDWEEIRGNTRSIIRSSIPGKQPLDVCDIDFAGAATKLTNLISTSLADVPRTHTSWMSGRGATSQAIDGFYSAVALSIALEVFGATPPEWSVRRTSFAVAGYFAALSQQARPPPSSAPRPAFFLSFPRLASVSQKLFWAMRCARDDSRCLEAEGEDISAALALVLGSSSQLGRHLADRLRSRPAEEMLPLVLRCRSYLDKLEASVKFVQRCPEAREWGAEQVITPRMIPSRANIRHWLLPEQERFVEARQVLLNLQIARDSLQANGMYTEPPQTPTVRSNQHTRTGLALPGPPPHAPSLALPPVASTTPVELVKRE